MQQIQKWKEYSKILELSSAFFKPFLLFGMHTILVSGFFVYLFFHWCHKSRLSNLHLECFMASQRMNIFRSEPHFRARSANRACLQMVRIVPEMTQNGAREQFITEILVPRRFMDHTSNIHKKKHSRVLFFFCFFFLVTPKTCAYVSFAFALGK